MKRIILDYLRRWWVAYPINLITLPFVGGIAALVGPEGSLSFVLLFILPFMLPFTFELGRRPVGVMMALPVSRKVVALSYWCIAVLLPALLMAGTVALAGLLFPSASISSKSVAEILFGSLAFAGSSFYSFTLFLPDQKGSDPDKFMAILVWALFIPAAILIGSYLFPLRSVTTRSPADFLWGSLGLFLTVWGYLRSERLVSGRTRKRPGGGQQPARVSKRILTPKPCMARFGGLFFEVARRGFLFVLIYTTVVLALGKPGRGPNFFWPLLIAFGTMGSVALLSSGMRMLRSLPLSSGRLALTLLLMPLASILGMIAATAIAQWITRGHFLGADSAIFLIPMAGIVCITSGLAIRYGKDGPIIAMGLAMLSSLVLAGAVSAAHWPAAFWCLLGLCLMVAAFFLNRHWLRSSYSYRPSTGGFARR